MQRNKEKKKLLQNIRNNTYRNKFLINQQNPNDRKIKHPIQTVSLVEDHKKKWTRNDNEKIRVFAKYSKNVYKPFSRSTIQNESKLGNYLEAHFQWILLL